MQTFHVYTTLSKTDFLKMRRAQVTDLQGLFRLRSQNKKTTSFG
jgi:hypothetical protein